MPDTPHKPENQPAPAHIELGTLTIDLATAQALSEELILAIERSKQAPAAADLVHAAGHKPTVSIVMSRGAADRLHAAFASGPIEDCCIKRLCACPQPGGHD